MNGGNTGRDREAADARELFSDGDDTSPPRAPSASGGEYDLEGPSVEVNPPAGDPIPPVTRRRPAKPRESVEDRGEPLHESEARVDEVWSRWGEWGPTILRLAVIGAVVLFVTFLAVNAEWYGTAFLAFLVGLACLVAVSYPIAITLERPVRIAPEQAAKDFYASASHHVPQFRRMWLLLSAEGRQSGQFDSFGTFQSYWKHEMAKLRGSSVKAWTPLSFRVVDFDSDKSAGKTSAEAKYKLVVTPRGEEGRILLEAEVSTSLVRGPDRMWYLNVGTLPSGKSIRRD